MELSSAIAQLVKLTRPTNVNPKLTTGKYNTPNIFFIMGTPSIWNNSIIINFLYRTERVGYCYT
ncbi:hypothetical protein CCP3SC1_1230006 [Gammaproteobacteria bacterium]